MQIGVGVGLPFGAVLQAIPAECPQTLDDVTTATAGCSGVVSYSCAGSLYPDYIQFGAFCTAGSVTNLGTWILDASVPEVQFQTTDPETGNPVTITYPLTPEQLEECRTVFNSMFGLCPPA